jgi:uncharacterized protein
MSQIAIISDSHDNPARIDQMLEILKKKTIKTIIHCGDVCSFRVLNYLSKNFKGKVYLSIGNVDADHEINEERNNLANLKIFPKFGELEIDNIKIAFVHFPNKAKELGETGKHDFVFYGHTHKPWEEEIDNCKIINPGTLAGLFTRSTFAILDTKTKKVELIIL